MKFLQSTAILAFVALPGLAGAQGFTGAELSAGVIAYADDTDFGATSYAGGAQFAIIPGLAAGANISRHNLRGEDGNSTSFTLHGLYELGPDFTAGLFIGQDLRDAGDTDFYGAEVAARISGIEVESFFGRYEGQIGEGTMIGLDGDFLLTNEIAAIGRAALVNGREDMTSVAVGGEYRFYQGPAVYAEIGRSDFDGNGDTFIAVGAKIDLGSGTAFSGRGITDIFPNF